MQINHTLSFVLCFCVEEREPEPESVCNASFHETPDYILPLNKNCSTCFVKCFDLNSPDCAGSELQHYEHCYAYYVKPLCHHS